MPYKKVFTLSNIIFIILVSLIKQKFLTLKFKISISLGLS